MQEDQETKFHIVKCDKGRTSFSFHRTPTELLYASFGPERNSPPRYTVARLRNWKPYLDDMLVIGASNSIDFAMLTSASAPIAAEQEVLNDYTITGVDDNRRATLPTAVGEDDGEDSVLIGEALDLSSKDKIPSPIPADDEYTESPGPVPALLALSYQGLLSAWWIVYDKSIREGTNYPGLVTSSEASATTPAPVATPSAPKPTQTNSIFGKPSATFGTPTTPAFGTNGFQASNTTFGKPSQPAFGATSSFGKPSQPTFGAASSFGKPSQPTFGSASAIGTPGNSGFGATGALGKSQSPWGAASQGSAPQTAQNPFSSQAGAASGFAKFGGTNNTTGSAFSNLSNNNAQSPFSSLGGQKSAISGSTNEPFRGLSTAQSFGSTVTVGSSLGDGSTLPSWANTPAQQGGSIFGAGTSSFASTKESDMSDADDAQNRERDEATPTPQPPPQQPNNAFGLQSNGFKLVSSFKGDGSAKDDLPKPAASSDGSLFGGDFASALGPGVSKPPATPIKKEEEEPRLQDISTTPASPPKPSHSALFPSATPAKQPSILKKAPSPQAEPVIPEDAPLPPDPTTWKPKSTEDDLPPLAGSPAIKVEAPDSDVPSSPLEDKTDKEDDFSVEEQDGDDEDEQEPSPSDTARRTRQTGFRFQDSVNQSPQIRPAAPTPPTVKSGPSSQSGDQSRDASQSPAPSRLFGQAAKPATSSIFQHSTTLGGFPKPTTVFPPTSSRAQENLRSPSPVRAASTSAIGTRRHQMMPQGTSLPPSVQQAAKPPTPQPELSDLSDDENERIRQELASKIVPSRTLDKFVAHQDYTGSVTKTGTAAQIEIIYRDMNSMVDTVGLNARSLASWIAYHKTRKPVTRDDLEEVNDQGEDGPWFDSWCLAQIEDLKSLEQQLQADLEAGRVQNVLDKLAQLGRLLRESSKVLTKINDIRRQIINRKDPDRVEALRKASLPKELSEQQKALRLEYSRLLTLLSQAEEAAFLLKSKLASTAAVNGKSTTAMPTVDAVKKTINKLIQMTEKKNNDILLLEAQMHKLHLAGTGSRPTSSSSRALGTPSRSSRTLVRQSPLPTTPQTGRSKMSLSELNRTVQTPEPDDTPSRGYGLFYTPDGSPTANGSDSLLKLANQMEDGNIDGLREAQARRKKVAGALVEAVKKRGVKVTNVANVQQ